MEVQYGFGFDVDLDWAFWLVDWSRSTVDLTLGAPDLYPIRTAAEEEWSAEGSVQRRSQSASLLTLPLTHCLISSVLAIESRTPGHPATAAVASAVAALHLHLLLWCCIRLSYLHNGMISLSTPTCTI